MFKYELEIDIGRCVDTLLKKKKFIIIITLLFFIFETALTIQTEQDRYSATATAYASADNSYTDAANAVTAMNAYIDVAKSYKVCQRAALILGRNNVEAEDIQNSVEVGTSAKKNSGSSSNFLNSAATIISFTATTTDPELAMEMADAVMQSYTKEMAEILHTDSVKALDTAYTYSLSYDSSRETIKNRIIFAFLGFLLSSFIVVACEIFDKRVRTVRDATIKDQLPVIGVIPDFKE